MIPRPSLSVADQGDEMDGLVAKVVRHMLFNNRGRPNVPVKRAQLTQVIGKASRQHYVPSTVIARAQQKLLTLFGLEMKEFQRPSPQVKARSAAGAPRAPQRYKEYFLASTIPEANLRKHAAAPGVSHLGLALLVVAVVKFAGGEKVPEDELLAHLRRVGVTPEAPHPELGGLERALDALARQRYICKERATGRGGGFVYGLAQRALDDVVFKQRLEAFVARHAAPRRRG